MALFTGTNFHKTFAIIIKFHLKLLCNNVTMYVFPSLTVKFIKTPLKALFYLGFSAVSFRFTI